MKKLVWRMLSGAAAATLFASAAQAALLVDRGLPDENLNNAAGANRSNVSWDFGGFGYIAGDDFTLGGPAGTVYRIDTIRTWVVAGPADNDADTSDETFALSDRFASLSLFVGSNAASLGEIASGNFTGGNGTDNANISIARVQYQAALSSIIKARRLPSSTSSRSISTT